MNSMLRTSSLTQVPCPESKWYCCALLWPFLSICECPWALPSARSQSLPFIWTVIQSIPRRITNCSSLLKMCDCAHVPWESWCTSRAMLRVQLRYLNGNLIEHTTAEKKPRVPDSQPYEGCVRGQEMPEVGEMGILGPTWNRCRNTAVKAFGLKSTARAIFNHWAGKSWSLHHSLPNSEL